MGNRRRFLQAVALGMLTLAAPRASADDENPEAEERPQKDDQFVSDDDETKIIGPDDLQLDQQPITVWPYDAQKKVVRDGSRLNQVLLVKIDPKTMDETTKAHAADGIVAYSAICKHQGCPVTGWVKDQGKLVFKCFCHNSEYDPAQDGQVVFGPAPASLPALPLKIVDNKLTAAGSFTGRVGPVQQT
jgi:rieske iron-sulfur protein